MKKQNNNNKIKGFTKVENKHIYAKLSPTAFYVFVYMLSKSEKWNFRQSTIAKELGITLYATKQATKELQEKGYIKIQKVRLESGRGFATKYIIHEK